MRPAIAFDHDPEPLLSQRMASDVAPVGQPSESLPPALPSPARVETTAPVTFLDLYEAHLSFVWNGVRRLGVPESAIEDVVQEVFLVVHRKLGEFEGRSSMRTWLFGIALLVVRHYLGARSARRRGSNRTTWIPFRTRARAARSNRPSAGR